MRTIYLILTFVCCIIAKAETFPYRSIASFNISPASESHCMILDSEGMMWVGTNSGLKSYDGYTVKSYKSNALSPGILPNNDIRSMAEDHEQNLWLGTRNGLVKINRKTGVFKTYFLPSEDQRITTISLFREMVHSGLVQMEDYLISIRKMNPSIPILPGMPGASMKTERNSASILSA